MVSKFKHHIEVKRTHVIDKIRNELMDKGILIEDKDGKTIWKIK